MNEHLTIGVELGAVDLGTTKIASALVMLDGKMLGLRRLSG